MAGVRGKDVVVAIVLLVLWHAVFLYLLKSAHPEVRPIAPDWSLHADPLDR